MYPRNFFCSTASWVVGVFLSSNSCATPPHVHGVGRLNVSIERSQLILALAAPLDTFVGFERPPVTDKEKDAYAEMSKTLNSAVQLFAPAAGAGCTLKSSRVALPFSENALSTGGHPEVAADYVFQCAQPAALTGFETSLFRRFPRLYRLEARRAGVSGEAESRLSPKNPGLSW